MPVTPPALRRTRGLDRQGVVDEAARLQQGGQVGKQGALQLGVAGQAAAIVADCVQGERAGWLERRVEEVLSLWHPTAEHGILQLSRDRRARLEG